MIEFGNQDHAFDLAREIGIHFNPDCDIVVSRTSSSAMLLGGVIYQGWTGASIEMHVAGFAPNWLCQDLLWAAFDYPFNQLNARKTFALIRSSNIKAVEFNRKLGFKEEARLAGAYPDGDMIITSMRREECRWLSLTPKTIRSNVS